MIVQIELQLSKCTRLVQCNVKIWFEDRKNSGLQVEEGSVQFEASLYILI
jgi:hypothetical protein